MLVIFLEYPYHELLMSNDTKTDESDDHAGLHEPSNFIAPPESCNLLQVKDH